MIDAQKATSPCARMAELLGVSRSGYYAWAQPGGPLRRGRARCAGLELVVKIEVAHEASDGVNGAPRITADLRDAGEVVSREDDREIDASRAGSAGSALARGGR